MRTFTKALLMLIIVSLTGKKLQAQSDPHFSGYYVYPSWLNPALTGVFDGSYRLSGIYRSQWGSVNSPFKTYGVAADVKTNSNINVGGSLLNQAAGDGGYNYTTAYGSASYTGVRLGDFEQHRIVFGLQAGFIQRKFDPAKLHYGDQWNPITGYNPANTTNDMITKTSSMTFDAGFGILYYNAQPGKKYNLFGGFSAMHLNRPADQFSATGDARIPVRYTAHGGVRVQLSELFTLTPNVLYMRQGTAQEKMLGAFGSYKLSEETDLMLGANYRFKDAFALYTGFNYKNVMLGLSYDVNSSDLGKISRGSNSFELSISFIGRKKLKTPAGEFVCPRL
jgi:type IX secretion system PorP/SprF family membrane protein